MIVATPPPPPDLGPHAREFALDLDPRSHAPISRDSFFLASRDLNG